jgi:hypothetical protein
MTVLVLARDVDPQVDLVVEELTLRGVPVFRTDLVTFPQSLTLNSRLGPDGWDGELANEHRSVRLKDIRLVWYRHPSHFVFPEKLSRRLHLCAAVPAARQRPGHQRRHRPRADRPGRRAAGRQRLHPHPGRRRWNGRLPSGRAL